MQEAASDRGAVRPNETFAVRMRGSVRASLGCQGETPRANSRSSLGKGKMSPRLILAVSALLTGSGCVSAPVSEPKEVGTSTIYKPAVLGPHGEHLVEIACGTPDACMGFGRQVCQGDFDIITHSDFTFGGNGLIINNTILMLIQCKNLPSALDVPPLSAEPAK